MPSSWHRGEYQEPTSRNMESGQVSGSDTQSAVLLLWSDSHVSIPQL